MSTAILILLSPIIIYGWMHLLGLDGKRKGRAYTSEEITQMTKELQQCKTQAQKNGVLRKWRNS